VTREDLEKTFKMVEGWKAHPLFKVEVLEVKPYDFPVSEILEIMEIMKKLQGRRREDTKLGDLPPDILPGDYWKILDADGTPKKSTAASNLTRTCWHVAVPLGEGEDAYSLGNLINHTVREHEDGTISVLPGDGSSNSILISRGKKSWHGYVRHGVLEEC
jgi:hypothetical protein